MSMHNEAIKQSPRPADPLKSVPLGGPGPCITDEKPPTSPPPSTLSGPKRGDKDKPIAPPPPPRGNPRSGAPR